MIKGKPNFTYKFIYCLVKLFYPRIKVVYEESPEQGSFFVANHAEMRGPIIGALKFKDNSAFWIINNALDKEKALSYAYHDVFIGRSKKHKGFYKFLSKVVANILPKLLVSVNHVPVYHGSGYENTIKESIDAFEQNMNNFVFAESPVKYSEYINKLQTGFVDVAKEYYSKTGKKLKFYPVYLEKKNRKVMVGSPIQYDPNIPLLKQRDIIGDYLVTNIDRLARSLKKHKPISFMNESWYEYYDEYTYKFGQYWKMIDEDETFKKHQK